MHVHSKTSAAFWDSIAQGGSSEDMRVRFQDMQRLSRSVVVPHMNVMEFRRSLDAKFSRSVATGEYLPCSLFFLHLFLSFPFSLPFLVARMGRRAHQASLLVLLVAEIGSTTGPSWERIRNILIIGSLEFFSYTGRLPMNPIVQALFERFSFVLSLSPSPSPSPSFFFVLSLF